MTANASAHKLRVFVGSENWSRQLVSFDAGQDQRSDSGLLLTTGTLVLAQTAGVPGSMNPRSNEGKQRWWRGQRILIDATDSSGTYVRHCYGWLYLLKAPQPPQEGQLTLELGCILSLRNFVQPDEDASGIQYPVDGSQPPFVDRGTIVNKLLAAAGCPPCLDSVPLYPLQTPQAKQGGSFVEQAGKIAYAGLRYLYQDNQGSIRAVSSALGSNAPIVTVTIGRDEIRYEAYEGSETPCETIKCVGSGVRLISNYGTEESYEEEHGIITVNNNTSTGVSRTIYTKETINSFGRERIETIKAWGANVSPVAFPGSTSLVLDTHTEEEYVYDAVVPGSSRQGDSESGVGEVTTGGVGNTGNLKRVVKRIYRLFPAACPEYFEQLGSLQLGPFYQSSLAGKVIQAQRERTSYAYTAEDLLKTQDRRLRERVEALVPDEAFSQVSTVGGSIEFGLTESEAETIEYQRTNPRIGKRKTRLLQAIAKAYPDFELPSVLSFYDQIDIKTSLIGRKNKTELSTTGQLNPPAAERLVEPFTEEEYPLEGIARFSLSPFVTANQERERTIQVEGGIVSEAQLSQIAQIRGAEIIGLAQGQTVQLPLYDVFLNAGSPFIEVRAIEPDGTVLRFITNGIQISHDPNNAIVGFTGIWIGTTEISQADRFVPPYESVTSSSESLVIPAPAHVKRECYGGAIAGGVVRILPYLPQHRSFDVRSGMKAGGRFEVATNDVLIMMIWGGGRSGGSFEVLTESQPEIIVLQGGTKSGGRVTVSASSSPIVVTSNGEPVTSGGAIVVVSSES
jgi:hypothetical protein